MLFTGEYEYTIDAKQRLAIPSDIRGQMEAAGVAPAFFLVPGPNGALWLWPQRTFERMAQALDQTLLPPAEQMEFEELLFSQAARLVMDKSGRVRLPERLMRIAGIGQSVCILGVKDHLELRRPEDWTSRRDQKLETQGEIMLRARRAMIDSAKRERAEGEG